MKLKSLAVLLLAMFALAACASSGGQHGDPDPNSASKPFDHDLDARGT